MKKVDSKDESKDKVLLQLLNKLSELGTQFSIVDNAEHTKETNEDIESELQKFKNYLQKQSEKYGRSNKDIIEIAEKYKIFLNKTKERYSEKRNFYAAKREIYNTNEIKLKAEYKEIKAKLKENKKTPGYENVMEFRKAINEFKAEGRKKKAAKKEAEYAIYKYDVECKIENLQSKLEKMIIEQKNEIDEDKKYERYENIKNTTRRLKKLQQKQLCIDCDAKLENLKEDIEANKKQIKEVNAKIKECDQNCKKELKKLDLEKQAEIDKKSGQKKFERLIGKIYSKISGKEEIKNDIVQQIQEKTDENEEKAEKIDVKAIIQKAKKTKNKILKVLSTDLFEKTMQSKEKNKEDVYIDK